jgi:hypothetical protein
VRGIVLSRRAVVPSEIVILSEAKDRLAIGPILRFAQDDSAEEA